MANIDNLMNTKWMNKLIEATENQWIQFVICGPDDVGKTSLIMECLWMLDMHLPVIGIKNVSHTDMRKIMFDPKVSEFDKTITSLLDASMTFNSVKPTLDYHTGGILLQDRSALTSVPAYNFPNLTPAQQTVANFYASNIDVLLPQHYYFILSGERLTPKEVDWYTPYQENAIKSYDKLAYVGNINTNRIYNIQLPIVSKFDRAVMLMETMVSKL